jgi:hypothetical protein
VQLEVEQGVDLAVVVMAGLEEVAVLELQTLLQFLMAL